ncbi:MAG: hypothetical protein Kow0074_09720 [Candidatus Zixiibacteriota bacterium]
MTHTKLWGRVFLATALALVVASAPAMALEDISFNEVKTFTHSSGPEMDLESVAGDVTYRGVPGATETTVEIVIEVRAADEEEARRIVDAVEIVVEGTTDHLEAYVDRPDDFGRMLRKRYGRDREIAVSFHVTGPATAKGSLSSVSGFVKAELVAGPLNLSSVSGDVMARDVQERVRANSVSGQVSVTDCHTDVRVKSVSGDVVVGNCGGDLEAESVSGGLAIKDVVGRAEISSVSGDVDATEVGGTLRAHTTSGQIDVSHHSGDLQLETVSGDIVARSESTDGTLELSSHSGSVRLYADITQIGKVDLSTFSGNMRVDSDLDHRNALERARGRGSLSFTLGDGDLYVDMNTHSGDIYVGEL